MPAVGFPLSRLVYIFGSGLLAIVGLFAIAGATDVGMSFFGTALTIASIAFCLFMVKRGADSLWG